MVFYLSFFQKQAKSVVACYECPESNKKFKLVQKIEKHIKSIIVGYF